MYNRHLNIMNYDDIKVEDLILDYFKERRTSDLPFIDFSIYDIIIKNILVLKHFHLMMRRHLKQKNNI